MNYRVRSQVTFGEGQVIRDWEGAGEGFWDVSNILILDQDGGCIGFAL